MIQRNRTTLKTDRRGAVVLELILVLPISIIMLMAVVQFGLLISHQQRLAMASRAGAKVAAEMVLPTAGPVPAEVQNAISRELSSSAINAGRIILEHNLGGGPYTLTTGTLNCSAAAHPSPPTSGTFVRVIVCAETTQLTPNLLRNYGFDLSGRVSQQTVTYRYKL